MRIEISEHGQVIWIRDTRTHEGLACTHYAKDGTQQRIIAALEDALNQASAELLYSDLAHSVENAGCQQDPMAVI